MSFVDRNKRWVLPAVGLAVAGVVWMNLAARSRARPQGEAPAPESASPGPPRPDPEPAGFGRDLKDLEAPPPSANDPAPLLERGREPLDPAVPAGPVPHPERWGGLYQPPRPAPEPVPAGPLPQVDFLIQAGARQEAWVGGRGYRPGADLGGGYTLRRITRSGVVVAGPRGEVAIPLHSGPPPAAAAPSPHPDEAAP